MITPEYIADTIILSLTEHQAKYKQKGDPSKPKIKDQRSLDNLRRQYRKQLIAMESSPHTPENPELDQLEKVRQLLESAGISPEQVGKIHRVSLWQGLRNNGEETEVVDLASVQFSPNEVEAEVDQLFISRAAPTEINPIEVPTITRDDKLTVCLGDAQIGFRGEEAFHDEDAMALSLMAIQKLQPDNVVFTGDMIDLPNMSRWEQRGDWLDTTQRSIDRYHKYLAEVRANAPNARIVVVHGNHESRMDTAVRRDAAPFFGISRANADRELPVLTIQFLARYDELGVEVVDGYPNAAHWLEDDLKVTHGTNVKKGGFNSGKYLQEENESTIFGHTHRLELAQRRIATRLGSRVITAASPGCLARVDGAVPGYRYSVDALGETVLRAEDWQQGMLIINHSADRHDIQTVQFLNRAMRLQDTMYQLPEYKDEN